MGRGHISGIATDKGVTSRVKILFPSQYISEAGAAKTRVSPTDFSSIDFTKEARKAAHFPTWPCSMSWSWAALAVEIWAFVLARGTCTPSEPLALLPILTVEHVCYQEAESQCDNGGRKKVRTEFLVGFFKLLFWLAGLHDTLECFYCSNHSAALLHASERIPNCGT